MAAKNSGATFPLHDPLIKLAQVIADKTGLQAANAQPEDQLKPPVQALVQQAGVNIKAKLEARATDLGRPDIGVLVADALTGYVELKAPGLGSNTSKFRGRDKDQWDKFKSIPNLIYTDGCSWTLYRDGKKYASVTFPDMEEEGEKAITPDLAFELQNLLTAFFSWAPIVPSTPKALAETLAPLCRLLRSDVATSLATEGSPIQVLNQEIRRYLFPDATDKQFADIYAQTLTYALLLARLSGNTHLSAESAAETLDSGHGLLAQTLRMLSQPEARGEVGVAVDILERVIAAIDPAKLNKRGDPWLYFYEDFLAAYDPKLRNERGVYYTPAQVIQCQVRLGAELLETKFKKPLNYADSDVIFLDPSAGTAAYPLAAIDHALSRIEDKYGAGMVSSKATDCANNFHAFEILVGPYAVAHLRLTQLIKGYGGELPDDGAHVYLTDTLESPHAEIPPLILFAKKLTDEHRRATRIKKSKRVWVCMGNPPYDREQREEDTPQAERRKGGWVRYGDESDKDHPAPLPILNDFIEPATQAGAGVHVKNLYNDYVYFWRWALWKMFENPEVNGPGIISFITASSFLRGPGFVGMRHKMRETFDEIWIIDLEGDNLGARKTENVFAIQTPVAITIGVRYANPVPTTPATVHYSKIVGTREEKLTRLDSIKKLSDLEWQTCFTEWGKPFLPETSGPYFDWPLLTDIFPWQHSGVQFKRTWPIGQSTEQLRKRWSAFLKANIGIRKDLFGETRDRKINRPYQQVDGTTSKALSELQENAPIPTCIPYYYRSFDRQVALLDARLGDYIRPTLWHNHNERQLYLTSLLTKVLGAGPSASLSCVPPDMDYFCGRGGKDVIPLWKSSGTIEPNITHDFLSTISEELGQSVDPEDLFSYVYAILASPSYVEKYSEELTIPGPRIPITKDVQLFSETVRTGRRLIWLHTYGQRMVPAGRSLGEVPQGVARCTKAIPTQIELYPEEFSYDATSQTLIVGDGEISPVSKAIYDFSISGLEVVKSWLSYRMKKGYGRKSSELDDIRPERWTADMTTQLLELIWVLEQTIAEYPQLASLLNRICASDTFTADELPKPSPAERKPPAEEEDNAEEASSLQQDLLPNNE